MIEMGSIKKIGEGHNCRISTRTKSVILQRHEPFCRDGRFVSSAWGYSMQFKINKFNQK